MKIIGSILILIWVITGSLTILSLPKSARLICGSNCEKAETITRIVGGKSGLIEAELKLMEVEVGEKLFTRAEISHLRDVSRLLFLVRIIWIFVSFSLILMEKEFLHGSILPSVKMGLSLIGILGLTALLDWEGFFILFHKTVFPQGNWAFPSESNLLLIFPEVFWQRMAGSLLLLTISFYGMLVLAGRKFWVGRN